MPERRKNKPPGSYPLLFATIVAEGAGTLEGKADDVAYGWTIKSTIVRFRYYVAALRARPNWGHLHNRACALRFRVELFRDGTPRARVSSTPIRDDSA